MGSDSIPLWIIFALCVIGGAYFAATESSFSAINKIKVKTLAEDGNRRAKGVMFILNKFDKALTTLLIGNNVTKIAGAAVFTIIFTDIFEKGLGYNEEFLNSFAFSMLCSIMSTVIIFLFSEMIPKSFANDRSETVSLFFQGSLRLLMKILTPFSALFGLISKLLDKKEAEPSITEDELTEIIDTAEEEGIVNEEQGDMLKSALEFAKTTVGDIMTMEKDVDYLRINYSSEQILEAIKNTNFSRLPVKAASSDRVIGIVRIRAFLSEHRRNPNVSLRAVMTRPYIVRQSAKIDDLLNDMRQHKRQLAIVQDDHKNMVGLVTIEDILEELVGEIFDEEDVVDQNFQALGGNKYKINTHMIMAAAYEKMGLDRAPRGIAAKPMLSFMLEVLGHLPAEDESFMYGNLEFTVETVENGRVTEVVVHILDEEALAERQAADNSEEVSV